MRQQIPAPFIKCAGGKSQLLEQLALYLPNELKEGKITKYAEPFIGGGALFLYLAKLYPDLQFLIADINADLIVTYNAIKKRPELLCKHLAKLQDKYWNSSEPERKLLFYEIRSIYNEIRKKWNYSKYFPNKSVHLASYYIFLNKTCFNGLYRVNKQGGFNSPWGQYKKPKLFNPENILAISKILQNTDIKIVDFEDTKDWMDENTFAYFDPPYRPISETSNFTSYSFQSFNDKTQERLGQFFKDLNEVGSKVMLSNSNPQQINPKDDFFDKLYEGFNIRKIFAKRSINSKGHKRGLISELLITNY